MTFIGSIVLALLSFVSDVRVSVQRTDPAPTTVAFCGVHPDDPYGAQKARGLAESGIDISLGPCNQYDAATYSAAFPNTRYSDPATYMRLVKLNALAGMQTMVYDARVWSDDPAVRQEAIDFWSPVKRYIAAWDMGDEFGLNEWPILVHRWEIVRTQVDPVTGIPPFVNHIFYMAPFAVHDLPGFTLAFDQYDADHGVALAASLDPQVPNLMCAINFLAHGSFIPTQLQFAEDFPKLKEAGCDSYMIFGGVVPYGFGDLFGEFSLVDKLGNRSEWAYYLKENLK